MSCLDLLNGAGTISCLALKDQRSLREEQSIQGPYLSVFELVMQKADLFLFFTSFLLSDSQKAKIFSSVGGLMHAPLQKYLVDGFA
jgi:hypothetical protein